MNRIGFRGQTYPVQFSRTEVTQDSPVAPFVDDAPAGRIGFRRPDVDVGHTEDEVVPPEFVRECLADSGE